MNDFNKTDEFQTGEDLREVRVLFKYIRFWKK